MQKLASCGEGASRRNREANRMCDDEETRRHGSTLEERDARRHAVLEGSAAKCCGSSAKACRCDFELNGEEGVAKGGAGLHLPGVGKSGRSWRTEALEGKISTFFRSLYGMVNSPADKQQSLTTQRLQALLRPLQNDEVWGSTESTGGMVGGDQELRVEILLVSPDGDSAADTTPAAAAERSERAGVSTLLGKDRSDRLKVREFRSVDKCMSYLEKKQHRIKQRQHARQMEGGTCMGTGVVSQVGDCKPVLGEGDRKPNRKARRALAAAAAAAAAAADKAATKVDARTEQLVQSTCINTTAESSAISSIVIHYVVLFAPSRLTPNEEPIELDMNENYRVYLGTSSHSLCSVYIIGVSLPLQLAESLSSWPASCHLCAPSVDSEPPARPAAINAYKLTPLRIIMQSNASIEFFSLDAASPKMIDAVDAVCGLVSLQALHVIIPRHRSSTKTQHVFSIKGANCSMLVSHCQVSDGSQDMAPPTQTSYFSYYGPSQPAPTVNAFTSLSSAHLILQDSDVISSSPSCLRSAVYSDGKASCALIACIVEGLGESGVSCCSGSSVAVVHCDIVRCGRSGIHAHGAATVRITCSNISNNGASGVECIACLTSGISQTHAQALGTSLSQVGDEPLMSNVMVLNSSLSWNGGSGMLNISTVSEAMQSTFTGNRLANISIIDSSHMRLRACAVMGSMKSGVYCRGEYSRFECKESDIAENQGLAVEYDNKYCARNINH
jgi:hypothetical protein